MILPGKVCIALYFCGVKSALLHKSAEKSMKAPRFVWANLPDKFMEQCRLWPEKLGSHADFAPQNHGGIVSGTKKINNNFLKFSFSQIS